MMQLPTHLNLARYLPRQKLLSSHFVSNTGPFMQLHMMAETLLPNKEIS